MTDDADRAMTWRELADALQLSKAQFYRYLAAGRFDRFELVPRIGPRRFSRSLVRAYLDREGTARGLRKVG